MAEKFILFYLMIKFDMSFNMIEKFNGIFYLIVLFIVHFIGFAVCMHIKLIIR